MSDDAVVALVPNEDLLERWPADKPFPATLRDLDLMAVLGVGKSWFYRRKVKGEFRFLELRPQLAAGNTLYSGRLVDRWVRGEFEEPRYFANARALRSVPSAAQSPRRGPGRPRKRAVGEE